MEKTNINNINLQPIKNGKFITGYIFLFDWKNPQLEFNYLPPTINEKELKLYDDLKTNYNLSSYQINLLMENIPTNDIFKTLYEIQLNKDKIKTNLSSYTWGVFSKKYNLKS
jgi:hypothetical protein